MPNYKDLQNNLYFLDDANDNDYLPAGCKQITEAEAEIIRTPTPLTTEQIRAQLAPLTAWQIRKVLTKFNRRDEAEAAVAASTQEVKDAWNHAGSFERGDEMLNAMAKALGWTDEQVDEMFTVGATL